MPGGTVCSIITCKSNSKKCKETGANLIFFTFPKNAEIRKEWVRICSRGGNWSEDNKRICSRHFKADDYLDEIQARVMKTVPRKLKQDAIPSLFVPGEPSPEQEVTCDPDEPDVEPFLSEETNTDILKRKIRDLEKENAILKQKIGAHEDNTRLLRLQVAELLDQVER